MKHYLLKIFLFVSLVSFAQETSYEITYQRSSNGRIIENQDLLKVFVTNNQAVLSSEKIEANQAVLPFEKTLINTKELSFYQTATLSGNKIISYKDSDAIKNQKLELLPETKKILGYLCKKAKNDN